MKVYIPASLSSPLGWIGATGRAADVLELEDTVINEGKDLPKVTQCISRRVPRALPPKPSPPKSVLQQETGLPPVETVKGTNSNSRDALTPRSDAGLWGLCFLPS